MNNKKKLLVKIMTGALIITSLTSNSSYAIEQNNFEHFSVEPISYNIEIDKDLNTEKEITFTDQEVYDALKKQGYDVDKVLRESNQNNFKMLRASKNSNGVNKITWRKDGGFDLYLSKNSLLVISGLGIGAVSALFGPLAPAATAIIASTVSMYAGGNISCGKVFRFTKVKIGKYDYKYAYLKSWNQ
ncbi:hypothetical protein [Terrisporobacter vanillatitrophus]|uniref:hypothetical protein n=1 Tax=Terrisporobacter vanillatitrophus TaxID=3058402 RepID=UPI0033677B49